MIHVFTADLSLLISYGCCMFFVIMIFLEIGIHLEYLNFVY